MAAYFTLQGFKWFSEIVFLNSDADTNEGCGCITLQQQYLREKAKVILSSVTLPIDSQSCSMSIVF